MTEKEACIEITGACPHRCLHCSSSSSPTVATTMPTDLLLRLLTVLAEDGTRLLAISGGEPLTHPGLLELIEQTCGLGIKTKLDTSGTTWAADGSCIPIVPPLAKRLRTAGLDRIVFNVQGHRPETHDAITGSEGSLARLRSSVKASVQAGLDVGFHFVPMKPNHQELPGVIKLARELHVRTVNLLRFVPQGRGHTNAHRLELSAPEAREFLEISAALRESSLSPRIKIGAAFAEFSGGTPLDGQCNVGPGNLHIDWRGDVLPCAAFKFNGNETYCSGNVLHDDVDALDSLPSCWLSLRRPTDAIAMCASCPAQVALRATQHELRHHNGDADRTPGKQNRLPVGA